MLSKLNPKNDTSPEQQSAINLTRFVYFQCFLKIQQRLSLPVRPGGFQFKDLFSLDQIKHHELRSRFDKSAIDYLVPDEKILHYGDGWITGFWVFCHGKEPGLEVRDGREYLVYDSKAAVALHKAIRYMFKLLCKDLEMVRCARQGNNGYVTDSYIKSVEDALDGVDYSMTFFASLVRSPCFWKHIRHPSLVDWVLNAARNDSDWNDEVWAPH